MNFLKEKSNLKMPKLLIYKVQLRCKLRKKDEKLIKKTLKLPSKTIKQLKQTRDKIDNKTNDNILWWEYKNGITY